MLQLLVPICTGLDLLAPVLSPRRPFAPWPQANNAPSLRIANEYPVDVTMLQLSVPSCVGLARLVASFRPNSPLALVPQTNKPPSLRIAIVGLFVLATTLVQLFVPICTGLDLAVEVPSPTCP